MNSITVYMQQLQVHRGYACRSVVAGPVSALEYFFLIISCTNVHSGTFTVLNQNIPLHELPIYYFILLMS